MAEATKHGHSAWSSTHGKIKHSKAGKWRAAVLILVHVLIAAHVLHWYLTGSTVSPIEPSEGIQTMREGIVNTGFVFFVLAIVSTLIMGRWFCGWGCHIVALQDLCSWMMSRVRVKPKPFRSRLLLWVPLIVALYMFVWPVFHRELLRPVFMDPYGNLPVWLGQNEPLDALRSEFLTTDFWATFAPWYIAIPFIFICTFGAVYFLGSKGFCTYGCPYGGFFAPVDRVAPGRIRVTDACEGCGHCTAVCTSNVRVHEEVRDFGMVVDPGCMKCMDCVSVCPNEALYFGFGRPAARAKPRKAARLTDEQARAARAKAKADRAARYDLSLWEEWAVAGLFLAYFLCFRGLAHSVPMLMALGIAGIGAFCTWKLWSLVRKDSVRLQSLQLKAKGRIRPAGWALALATVVLMAVGAWSGYVRYHAYRADLLFASIDTPFAVAMRPDYEPAAPEADTARRALAHFRRAAPPGDGPAHGGIGWPLSVNEKLNLAYLNVVLGELAAAETLLRDVIREGKPLDNLVLQTGQIVELRAARALLALEPARREQAAPQIQQDSQAKILALYTDALERHPRLDGIRSQLAGWHLANGRRDQADALWSDPAAGLDDKHPRPATLLAAAAYHAAAQRPDDARALAERAVADKHATPDTFLGAARLFAQLGQRDRAIDLARRAADKPTRRGNTLAAAAGLLVQLGEAPVALDKAERAAERARTLGPHAGRVQTLSDAGVIMLQLGRTAEGKALLMEAADLAGPAPWTLAAIAATLSGYTQQSGDAQGVELALDLLGRAVAIRPGSPVLKSDLASMLFFAGRVEDGLAAIKAAAETSRTNPEFPARYAEVLRQLGRPDDAAKWEQEAARRLKG